MGWKIKAALDFGTMILVAVGTPLAALEFGRTLGLILLAVAAGVKATAEYLAEAGVIERRRK